MDRNDAHQGNEDNSEAVEHVHRAQENRDALAEQSRRTEATAGDSAHHPVGEQHTSAADNSRAAHENRDALAEQNRRTNQTT